MKHLFHQIKDERYESARTVMVSWSAVAGRYEDLSDSTDARYDLIDDLTYTYANGQLTTITDAVGASVAGKFGFPTVQGDFAYDGAGNVTSDGVRNISYNVFNLPRTIEMVDQGDGEDVNHALTYLSSGSLYRRVGDGERTYIGALEIKDGEAEVYTFGDGRVVLKGGATKFQYKIADHLGNTVVLFEDRNEDGRITSDFANPGASEVLQRELYYSFGLELRGTAPLAPSPSQRNLYNGKEQIEKTGLYAYGFRYYDPVTARFTGVDPIADQFAFVSPFNYAENSPIGNIDLHGLQAQFAADGRLLSYRVQDGQGPTQIASDLSAQGYDVPWVSIVDNNPSYFSHITSSRYDRSNQAYRSLNMNTGDVLDLQFLNSQYESTGTAQFGGSGENIYNEAARIIRKNEFEGYNDPFTASELIDVKSRGYGLSSEISSTKSATSSAFSQISPGVYRGQFSNNSLGVDFSITLQDGGDNEVGTSYMGIYGNQVRSRRPNKAELGNNPYAYTVTLPLTSILGSSPSIMTVGFKTEEARNNFFQTSTSSQ